MPRSLDYGGDRQQPVELAIGDWRQSHPPALASDLKGLRSKGVEVFALKEDLEARGIAEGQLIDGVVLLTRSSPAGLVGGSGRVWHG